MKQLVSTCSQRGFSTVMVIGLIVLLATLTTYSLHFIQAVLTDQTQSLLQIRLDQAAQTGLEWQRYQLLKAPTQPGGCSAKINLTVRFTSGPVRVTIVCNRTPTATAVHSENGLNIYTYAFSATACMPSTGGQCPIVPDTAKPAAYVERSLQGIAACSTGACTW